MAKDNKVAAGDSVPESRFSRVMKVTDVILKLTPALATGVAAWIAYDFQSRSAGISLLNQREQAETQLRASMFNNLIGPIAGPAKDTPIKADQERVLVELLTLNFHEHVEFKPLLLHADRRLAAELSPKEARSSRDSLQSAVRRVRDRQLAVLRNDCTVDGQNRCEKSVVRFCDYNPVRGVPKKEPDKEPWMDVGVDQYQVINGFGGQPQRASSPDGKYLLLVAVEKAYWNDQSFDVSVGWGTDTDYKFTKFNLTPYDLPFTDNTILDSEHRFALVVGGTNTDTKCSFPDKPVFDKPKNTNEVPCQTLDLWVTWFPPHYVLPQERPVNFQEIRNILNLDTASKEPHAAARP
jgi:hypothetical protein